MAISALGLRGKSLLALLLACVLALIPVVGIGWSLTEAIRQHFGEAYARNLTLLNRERILAPLTRDLALSIRLADSQLLKRFFADESDAAARELFFREAEGYRRDFRDQSYFVIAAASGNYYFNEAGKPVSHEPRYAVSRDDPEDGWFYASLREAGAYNINVNYDAKLRTTRVWLNVLIREDDAVLGLAGTGLELDAFIAELMASAAQGVVPMIATDEGALQAHPDPDRIALNVAGEETGLERTLFGLVAPADHARLREAMAQSQARPDSAVLLPVGIDGRPQILALSYLPELRWHVATALDLGAAQVLDARWLPPAAGALLLLLALLLAGFAYSVERLLLRPLRALQRSAQAIAAGHYEVALPPPSGDEIGQLSGAFAVMADTVRRHTAELEDKVRARTAELERANAEMAAAHRKIDDSIDYASLIQRAFLPDRDIQRVLGDRHFLFWKPRDIVGGDFYVFRADGENFLIGVCDCAGHGVPGAMMTMLMRSTIDHALASLGPADPAAVLAHVDAALRRLLEEGQLSRLLATNTDVGLVYVERGARRLTFAGAAINLFISADGEVRQLAGSRRPLGDPRGGKYENCSAQVPPATTLYLATDGLLDQAGGEQGFGFGSSRFRALIQTQAGKPLDVQAAAFDVALSNWQGGHPQRDDITVLSFRLD